MSLNQAKIPVSFVVSLLTGFFQPTSKLVRSTIVGGGKCPKPDFGRKVIPMLAHKLYGYVMIFGAQPDETSGGQQFHIAVNGRMYWVHESCFIHN